MITESGTGERPPLSRMGAPTVTILRGVNRALGWIEMAALAVLTLAMFLVVFSQVVFRYVLNSPSPWTEELARYLFIWISLLGAAFGVMTRSHFGFDLVVKRMPASLQRKEHVFVGLCMGILVFVLIYFGVKMLGIVSFQITPALQIPMRYIYLSLPVSGCLMAFHLLCQLLHAEEKAAGVTLT
jgi:TRAP-type C4-dicarboxylate transport system permease small subunit